MVTCRMLRAINFRFGIRLYSVKPVKKDANKYTDTINLPRTRFPNRLSAAKREQLEQEILDVRYFVYWGMRTESQFTIYYFAA